MADGAEKKVTKTAAELDQELDEYLDQLEAKGKSEYKDGFTEENWEEEMDKIPLFRTKPIEDGEELSPEIAAMQALQYESENPTAKAEAYKEEGNYEYKKKNFRKAIIAYTEGITARSDDKNLNAFLYTNRATVNFTIGNNRSALKDALQARKFVPNYMKAILRGASACFNLKLFDHVKRWCDEGLKIEPNNEKLQGLQTDAIAEQKKDERDKRKAKQKQKKIQSEELALIDAINKRNIKYVKPTTKDDDSDDDDDNDNEAMLCKSLSKLGLDPHHPSGARVQLDENSKLYWPALFYYPEYQQTDFIAAFCEDNNFMEHFRNMFGNDSAPWDVDNKYEPENLECYFENQEARTLCRVSNWTCLKDVLSDHRFLVRQGTASFIILVKNSSFRTEFLNKYSKK